MDIRFTWRPEGDGRIAEDAFRHLIESEVPVVIGDKTVFGLLQAAEVAKDGRSAELRIFLPEAFVPAELHLTVPGYSLPGAGRVPPS